MIVTTKGATEMIIIITIIVIDDDNVDKNLNWWERLRRYMMIIC